MAAAIIINPMYGFKKNFFFVLVVVFLFSCKARQYGFDPNTIITDELRNDIDLYVSNKKPKDIPSAARGRVVETWLYTARLEEKLVNENAVSDYKIMNAKSNKNVVDVEVEGNYHILYLYLFKVSNKMQYGLFVSAGYNPSNQCIGVGPAYIGRVESGKENKTFSTQWQLKLKKCKGKVTLLNKKTDSIVLQFFSNVPMMQPQYNELQFYQVIQKTGNKIGSTGKMLVYDVNKVFNDPDALLFELADFMSYK